MIKRCDCASNQQDDLHGSQMRVMNKTSKLSPVTYRCTVCLKEHSTNEKESIHTTKKSGKK
jgi:hypothetical protein